MMHYLVNPELKWFKANLHCHSTGSDGYFSAEQIKSIYKKQGYSIVAITDHELIFDHSNLNDKTFIFLTSAEFSINDNKHVANDVYVKLNEEGNASWSDFKLFHFNIFAKDPHNVIHPASNIDDFADFILDRYPNRNPICDGYHRVYTKESIQKMIDLMNEEGWLVQMNHPNWSLTTREDFISIKGLWGLEIYNHCTDLETAADYCPNIYDDMIRNGHKIYCTMGDDNHNQKGTIKNCFGGFNYLGMKSLTYENAMHSLEFGKFYCSQGPQIKSLTFNDQNREVVVNCTKASNVTLTGLNRYFSYIHGKNLRKACFVLRDDQQCFRITVTDKFNRKAHTSTYFINDILEGKYDN